jgi:hypothetical protein
LIKNKLPAKILGYSLNFLMEKVYLECKNLQIVFRLEFSQDYNDTQTRLVLCDYKLNIDEFLDDMCTVVNETRM